MGIDIQAEIDQISTNGGGVVDLPAGTFHLESPIRITSSIVIQGKGRGITQIKAPQDGSPCFSVVGLDLTQTRIALSGFSCWDSINAPAISMENVWGVSLSEIELNNSDIGLSADHCGVIDGQRIYLSNCATVGIRISNLESDVFFSKIHSNNGTGDFADISTWVCPNAIGLLIENAGGIHISESDFIGGLHGIVLNGGPQSRWTKFTGVSADTVFGDAWQINQYKGLQLANCWSGSFVNGSGIYLGQDVDAAISNHQWQNGKVGITAHTSKVTFIGGLMGTRSTIGVPILCTTNPGPARFGTIGLP